MRRKQQVNFSQQTSVDGMIIECIINIKNVVITNHHKVQQWHSSIYL